MAPRKMLKLRSGTVAGHDGWTLCNVVGGFLPLVFCQRISVNQEGDLQSQCFFPILLLANSRTVKLSD